MLTLEELATEMEYFNDQLLHATDYDNSNLMRRVRDLEKSINRSSKHRARTHEVEVQEAEAETNQIGQKSNTPNTNSNNTSKPKHPPANNVVSKGKTPEQARGRPCRHCGSKNHWDYDCPFSEYQKKFKSNKFNKKPFKKQFNRFKKKFRKAQTEFINLDDETWDAFTHYEESELCSEDSEESANLSEESSDSESEKPEDF